MSQPLGRETTPRRRALPLRARLHVVGDICPSLLPRILGVVAQFDTIPWSMALTRTRTSLRLAIDLDRPEGPRADILVHKVGAIPTVRRATLVTPRRR